MITDEHFLREKLRRDAQEIVNYMDQASVADSEGDGEQVLRNTLCASVLGMISLPYTCQKLLDLQQDKEATRED